MRSDFFLLKEVLEVRLREFLKFERSRRVAVVLGLEQNIQGHIHFDSGKEYDFRARIDRIDRISDGTVVVIDYKTGDTSHLVPRKGSHAEASLFNRRWIKDNIKSFQLPLYLYFLQQKYGSERTNACLYNLREAGKRDCLNFLFSNNDEMADKDSLMAGYMAALEYTLAEINDPQKPFEADDSDEFACKYCPFGALCK